MKEQSQRQVYSWGSTAILIAGVATEAVRLVAPWRGFAPAASRTISVLLMLLWASTALVLHVRNRRPLLATVARLLAVAAAFAMGAHASVTRVGGSYFGLLYLAGTGLLTFAFVKIFSHERDPETRAWSPGAVEMSTAPSSKRHSET